ncbi:uncharacterized protein LOC125224638 [Leguminivora glycinivorella]|uniref:uncharacterized protein LOC125224638 n=1 Tax=Leguminivora glycinivorella TaxID=1035111 RepID=UPI00200FCB91|nr:uncharacterized protein LOC125224638 [Leguminivora glycinivorella]
MIGHMRRPRAHHATALDRNGRQSSMHGGVWRGAARGGVGRAGRAQGARAARRAGAPPPAAPAAAAAAGPSVCTEARVLHAEQARRRLRHPLLLLLRDHVDGEFPARRARHNLLLLRDHVDEEASMVGSPGEVLPSHWCEHEHRKHKNLKLHMHPDVMFDSELDSPEALELERRRRRRKRRQRAAAAAAAQPRKHRTLLVSAIDEQAKVIHVLDPDELPRRARYTIMVTACLLLFLCLLLVGVTLRMAPLIDDMVRQENERMMHDVLQLPPGNRTQLSGALR